MDATTLQVAASTLLIVDDDPLMTELFNKFMVKRGFRVLKAASGEEALHVVAAEASDVRLVMTDMTMPGMDGLALAAELGRLQPDLPVILTPGHNADMDTAVGLPNVRDVFRKPYQVGELAARIREILGGG